MLNRLTLVLRPASSYHAQIQKILREEHFDFQFGTLLKDFPEGDTTSEDVVLVTCVDFHDVGVVTEKLNSRTGLRLYLLDANSNIFSYHTIDRRLNPLGIVYRADEATTYNSHIKVGQTVYHFWEAVNNG